MDSMRMGGTETVLVNMLSSIDYSNYEITLWLRDISGELLNHVNPNVHIKKLDLNSPYSRIIKQYVANLSLFRATKSLFFRLLSRLFVSDYYHNFKYMLKSLPDLVVENYDCTIAYQAMNPDNLLIADILFKSKYKIAWIHMLCRHNKTENTFSAFKNTFPRMSKIFCVSKASKEHFLSVYPELRNRCEVFYNLLNSQDILRRAKESIYVPHKETVISTVGRLSKEKGQQLIPEVAALLVNDGYDFEWNIVGGGVMYDSLYEIIKSYGVENTVYLRGNQLNPYPFIDKCKIYVQPSLREAFCTSTLEAKVLNKAVITTDVDGMREQFEDEYDGIIVAPNSVQSLYLSIKDLLDNTDKRLMIEENTKKKCLNYDSELKKLYDIFD